MPIRFKCTHCQKGLVVKDHLSGKRVACPVCKKAVVVPAPAAPPEDVEALAAAALAEEDNKSKPQEKAAPKSTGTINFTCSYCDAELHLSVELAGKKEPCPECKRIIRVPNPVEDRPKDWRTVEAGPSVALAAKKEPEPEGAWGTSTTKTRVSQQALAEADAIPEEEEEPVGLFGWARRLTVLAVVGGLIYLAVLGINSAQQQRQQKDSLAQAVALVDGKEEKLAPAVIAEVHRGAGEIYLRKEQAKKARNSFGKALSKIPTASEKVAGQADNDLFLLRLALSQVELGGSEKQALNDERVQWKDLFDPDLLTTLERMGSDEARVMALREVGSRLMSHGQGPLAVGLAGKLKVGNSPVLGQWVALVFAQGQAKLAAKEVPPPEPGASIPDANTRCGYAEGNARKSDFDQAWKIVQAPGGTEAAQLQAALGVADLRLDNVQTSQDTALPNRFVHDAFELFEKVKEPSPWSRYQLIRAAAQANMIDKARELSKGATGDSKLWQELKSWAELEIVRAQVANSPGQAEASLPEQVTAKDSPARALAWQAWARHNARLGYLAEVRDALESQQDPQVKALLYLGMALAND